MSYCNNCGKWNGAAAVLPGQSTDHLCKCLTPAQQRILDAIPRTRVPVDLHNRIVQRLEWLVHDQPIDVQAFAADVRELLANHSGVEPSAGWVEAGLVCQACAGDAPGGKCKNPKCIGGPIVREMVPAAGVAPGEAPSVPESCMREIDLALAAMADLKPLVEYGQPGTFDTVQARRKTALLRAEGSLLYLRRVLNAGVALPRDDQPKGGA